MTSTRRARGGDATGATTNGNRRSAGSTIQLVRSARQAQESRPLRLLFVTARYIPFVGGTEIHTSEVAEGLAGRGYSVTVLTTDFSTRATWEEHLHGVRVVRVPAWPRGSDYYLAPGIYRYITRGTWDLIHIEGYHTLVAPVAMFAAIQRDIPFIVGFHSGGHSSRLREALRPLHQRALRPLLARAERLAGVSEFEIDHFRHRLQLPAEKFVTIPNGSNLPLDPSFQPNSRGQDGKVIICSVGRLERYKGHHFLIASLPYLRKELPNISVQIVGSGPYGPKLKRMAGRLRVDDLVEFISIPYDHRQRLAAILNRADLVVLLSSYESQGLTVYEALALGCRVLVADRAALGQLATRGAVHAVPPRSSSPELARALIRSIVGDERPTEVPLLSWTEVVDLLLEVYAETLGRPL